MNIQITGKHMELGEALQLYCETEIKKLLEKLNLSPTSCHVTFTKESHHAHKLTAEMILHLPHETPFITRAEGDSAQVCMDAALALLQEQLVRRKGRADDHQKHHDNHTYKKPGEMTEE